MAPIEKRLQRPCTKNDKALNYVNEEKKFKKYQNARLWTNLDAIKSYARMRDQIPKQPLPSIDNVKKRC